MSFVLDASVALLWLAPQTNPQGADYAAATLAAIKQHPAFVPTLFALDVSNAIAKLESMGLLSEADSHRYIALLERLDIGADHTAPANALGAVLGLARRYKLSAYDAVYLELALRTGMPLATLDADLIRAASSAGAPIFGAH